MYRVTAGYVTVEVELESGPAFVDVRRGQLLPPEVPAEQVDTLLARGDLEQVDEPKPRRTRRSV